MLLWALVWLSKKYARPHDRLRPEDMHNYRHAYQEFRATFRLVAAKKTWDERDISTSKMKITTFQLSIGMPVTRILNEEHIEN